MSVLLYVSVNHEHMPSSHTALLHLYQESTLDIYCCKATTDIVMINESHIISND
ncbi:hypothetical protein HanIR_Chr01g0005361 [Helianthus annuus]|nr:hypothetical protein HanIR_Chr01g0005361 [Helianthus annuus]